MAVQRKTDKYNLIFNKEEKDERIDCKNKNADNGNATFSGRITPKRGQVPETGTVSETASVTDNEITADFTHKEEAVAYQPVIPSIRISRSS